MSNETATATSATSATKKHRGKGKAPVGKTTPSEKMRVPTWIARVGEELAGVVSEGDRITVTDIKKLTTVKARLAAASPQFPQYILMQLLTHKRLKKFSAEKTRKIGNRYYNEYIVTAELFEPWPEVNAASLTELDKQELVRQEVGKELMKIFLTLPAMAAEIASFSSQRNSYTKQHTDT